MGRVAGVGGGRKFCEDPGDQGNLRKGACGAGYSRWWGSHFGTRSLQVYPVRLISVYGNVGAYFLAPFFGIFGTIAHCLVAKNADNADGSICASALTGGWTRFCATIWTG